MKNKSKVIILILGIGIIAGLTILGFKIHSMNKKTKPMTYKEASVKSKEIAEQKAKQDKYLKEINKNKELTPKEKQEQEVKEKTTSDLYKQYEKLSDEEKEKIDAIPREKDVPMEKLDEIIDDQKNIEVEIPSRFTLADKIDIQVENQGNRGLCWDFASMKSVETFLSLHEGKNYDFSEQHVNYITSNLLYGTRKIDNGGDFYDVVDYFELSGAVLEKDVPYDKDYGEDEYSKFIDMKPVKIVTDIAEFPAITKWVNDYSDEELNRFRDTVKKHIMTNGSIYTTIASGGILDNNCYISKENPSNRFVDHAISIVGWDDNYSKDNFNDGGNVPAHDGAYIALNSWGENAHFDKNTKTSSGYFYISYDDIYVEGDMSGISSVSFDENSTIDYDNIKSPGIKNYISKYYNYTIRELDGKKYIPKMWFRDQSFLNIKNADVDVSDLKYFTSLNSLELNNTNITSIDDLPAFDLYSINLSNNKLTNIDKLSEYKKLGNINVSNNNIQDVGKLKDSAVHNLDISNNSNVSGYSEIKTLTELNLSNNNISELENIDYDLIGLNISNNNFESMPIISSLYSLDISDNKIKDLNGIENITYLSNLNISGNSINNLSINKEGLMLEYSNVSIDDVKTLNNLNVWGLELKNDSIKSLEGFVPGSNLKYIDLSNNAGLKGYGKLNIEQIKLINCGIEELEDFRDKVTSLDISNNNISNIEKLSSSKNLTTLIINNNKSVISGNISGDKLRWLYFDNSKIGKDSRFNFDNKVDVTISDLGSYFNINKTCDKCRYIINNQKLDEEFLETTFDSTKEIYFSNMILEIDAYKEGNVIKIEDIPMIDSNSLTALYATINEDGAVISRDRRKIILEKEDIKKISFSATVSRNDKIYYPNVIVNIKEKESLLDSIFNLFR